MRRSGLALMMQGLGALGGLTCVADEIFTMRDEVALSFIVSTGLHGLEVIEACATTMMDVPASEAARAEIAERLIDGGCYLLEVEGGRPPSHHSRQLPRSLTLSTPGRCSKPQTLPTRVTTAAAAENLPIRHPA